MNSYGKHVTGDDTKVRSSGVCRRDMNYIQGCHDLRKLKVYFIFRNIKVCRQYRRKL